MSKFNLFVFTLLLLGMVMEKTAAGDCNGSRCGCYKNRCWTYVDEAKTIKGSWWCYTQPESNSDTSNTPDTCTSDDDCNWGIECSDCTQYTEFEKKTRHKCNS